MIESLFMFYLIDLPSVIDIVSVVHIKTTIQSNFLVSQGNCSKINRFLRKYRIHFTTL